MSAGDLTEVAAEWTKAADGSFLDEKGGVVFFSCKRFVDSICEGGSCFMCGAEPGSKPFNEEHILPEWVLREFSLFDRAVTLPNGNRVKYGKYKIPCCEDCNSELGRRIEEPVSALLHGGHAELGDYLQKSSGMLLIVWIALIYIKTHLKDRSFNMSLDRRVSKDPISTLYEWEDLHHVHTLARSYRSGAEISRQVCGTCLVLPAKEDAEPFDYSDMYQAQVALVRLRDVALLTVFNDSGAVFPHLRKILREASGPFSAVQIREIMVEAACCNLHLKERPKFVSQVDLRKQTYRMIAQQPPALEFHPIDLELRGKLMEQALRPMFQRAANTGCADPEEYWRKMRKGLQTFLYDDSGNFIRD
jgi:hypothetical protein